MSFELMARISKLEQRVLYLEQRLDRTEKAVEPISIVNSRPATKPILSLPKKA